VLRFAFGVVIVLAACHSSSGSDDDGDDTPSDDTPGDDTPSDDTPADDDAPPIDSAPSATCAGKTAQPLDAEWTVTVGGATRRANVHVPASYQPGTATPVILNIHGRTDNAAGQANLSHAIAKSDAEGFILVHPMSATSPTSWNSGTCCSPANSSGVDDVGFFNALVDKLKTDLCVDDNRIYAMGMSNGGYMSHTLACSVDWIAAIGPVAGLLLQSPCNPTHPIPAMLVNGTSDQLSQYSFVPQGVSFWADHNQCTTETETFRQGDIACVTHGGCTGGADVVLCTVDGGGHQWPGGEELPFLGHKSDNLITTDALWDFFMAHPRAAD
jgi:polyhydroxybutyrate depolymerase